MNKKERAREREAVRVGGVNARLGDSKKRYRVGRGKSLKKGIMVLFKLGAKERKKTNIMDHRCPADERRS